MFPRRCASDIPEHALGVRSYLEGRSPVSKMSDNEESTASLGDSEVLNVQHSVGEPVPELRHGPEEVSKSRPPMDDR